MDTVLVDPYHRLIERILPDAESLAVWKNHREPTAFDLWEKGKLTEDEYFDRFYRKHAAASVLVRPADIKDQLYSGIEFISGMEEILRELRSHGKLVLLSNYSPWYREVIRLRPELNDLFDVMFFSCELGVRKPAPEYFSAVLASLNLPFGSTVHFVDDRRENLVVPHRLGWVTHLFKDPEEFRVWIQGVIGKL